MNLERFGARMFYVGAAAGFVIGFVFGVLLS